MKFNRKLPDNDTIYNEYLELGTQKAVADKYNVTIAAVSYRLCMHRNYIKKNLTYMVRPSDDRILDDYDRYHNCTDMAADYGVAYSTAYTWFLQAGGICRSKKYDLPEDLEEINERIENHTEAADHYGVSVPTYKKWLIEIGVYEINDQRYKLPESDEDFYQTCLRFDYCNDKISSHYGCTVGAVCIRKKTLRDSGYDLPKKKRYYPTLMPDNNQILHDYKELGTQSALAALYGVSLTTVSNRIKVMRGNGINVPNNKNVKTSLPSIEQLSLEYEKLGTYKDVATIYGVSTSAMYKLLSKYRREMGLPTINKKGGKLPDIDQLKLDLEELGSQKAVAEKYGTSSASVSMKLRRMKNK